MDVPDADGGRTDSGPGAPTAQQEVLVSSSSSLESRPQSSTSVATLACLLLALCLFVVTPARAQVQDAAAALGIGATHGTVSFAPWEQIDTFTGNVLLTFTDINLPGNAGFDLTIRRHYNSKNGFCFYLDYGFPGVATVASPGIPVRDYPIILMPDGSQVRTLQDPNRCGSGTVPNGLRGHAVHGERADREGLGGRSLGVP
jgi:hypothetical protein